MLMAPPLVGTDVPGDMMQECKPGAPCAIGGGWVGSHTPSWLSGFCRADTVLGQQELSGLPAQLPLRVLRKGQEAVCRAPQYSEPLQEGGPLHRPQACQALGLPF